MTMTMRKETCLGPLGQIPVGEGRAFRVGDRTVAVFRTRSGAVFATQALCPHRAGPLADGLLGGTTLLCPLHAWKFDLVTGQPLLGSCGLTTYPIRVQADGRLFLTLPDESD
jgi:nitrite reductase (NADH) small subunit